MPVIENGSSLEIQTVITFYSYVRLSLVVYQDAQNSEQRILENSNDNKFLLGCPIESRNISRCSKLKLEARSKCKPQELLTPISD